MKLTIAFAYSRFFFFFYLVSFYRTDERTTDSRDTFSLGRKEGETQCGKNKNSLSLEKYFVKSIYRRIYSDKVKFAEL